MSNLNVSVQLNANDLELLWDGFEYLLKNEPPRTIEELNVVVVLKSKLEEARNFVGDLAEAKNESESPTCSHRYIEGTNWRCRECGDFINHPFFSFDPKLTRQVDGKPVTQMQCAVHFWSIENHRCKRCGLHKDDYGKEKK